MAHKRTITSIGLVLVQHTSAERVEPERVATGHLEQHLMAGIGQDRLASVALKCER